MFLPVSEGPEREFLGQIAPSKHKPEVLQQESNQASARQMMSLVSSS